MTQVVDNAIRSAYTAVDTTRRAMATDRGIIERVYLSILAAKLGGFSLITWGRNIGDWPNDVDFSQVRAWLLHT